MDGHYIAGSAHYLEITGSFAIAQAKKPFLGKKPHPRSCRSNRRPIQQRP